MSEVPLSEEYPELVQDLIDAERYLESQNDEEKERGDLAEIRRMVEAQPEAQPDAQPEAQPELKIRF